MFDGIINHTQSHGKSTMNKHTKSDHITLGQALKKYNLADSGGMAKSLIVAGEVFVDGVVETRRGRKLYGGETIKLGNVEVKVDDDCHTT